MTNMTIEESRHIHEEWQHSGLSIRQYCEDVGIRESRFYYWKAKLKAESLPASCWRKRSIATHSQLLISLILCCVKPKNW